jgi:probable selenium-dependent hydroxylase accessory protein YqeC
MNLVSALDADDGLVCVVGAGGKKTTLYTLANRLDRAVVTATVRIPLFDAQVERVVVTDDPVGALRDVDAWPVGLVPEQERADRYRGYPRETVTAIAATDAADAVLVKADGARTRLLKAPNEREPQLPAAADTVVPIASVRAVGEPLDEEAVHRPERVAALTDRKLGEEIRPVDVARVLSSRDGGLKSVPARATPIPLLNMVDTPELEATGREIAAEILDRTAVPRVVLARMNVPEVVAVVE